MDYDDQGDDGNGVVDAGSDYGLDLCNNNEHTRITMTATLLVTVLIYVTEFQHHVPFETDYG